MPKMPSLRVERKLMPKLKDYHKYIDDSHPSPSKRNQKRSSPKKKGKYNGELEKTER